MTKVRDEVCRTPDRVRNEFRMHLVGDNLFRGTLTAAARATNRRPQQISLKGTRQTLARFLPPVTSTAAIETRERALFSAVSAHAVGNRPNRYEPRLTQRRPKKFKHLREPRQNYRRRMR